MKNKSKVRKINKRHTLERKQHNCLHRKFQGIHTQTHTLEQIIEFSKIAGYEDNMEKSIAC